MKPRCLLRIWPRLSLFNLFILCPLTRTSPSSGISNPPNKCNNVLFPEPDAPIIEMLCPFSTVIATPFNTSTDKFPSLNDFLKFRPVII